MQKEKPAAKKNIFKRVALALMPKFRAPKNAPMPAQDDPFSVIQDYGAKYSDGRQIEMQDIVLLAKKAICPLTLREQVMSNNLMDAPIIRALLDVHREAKGSGAATVAAAKAAMQAAKTHMPKIHIEETLKSISHIAHYTKSVDATISCAETASLYEGDGAANVAGMLFSVILPYNFAEKPKDVVMRTAAFLRDEEVMAMVEDSPFLLEIASYTRSKPAMWGCISLGAEFFLFPVPGIPPYVRLGIAKVARATRSGEEVVRWTGLIKDHITKGKINDRLMILLLCQFGIQAGDVIPNNLYDIGLRDAAKSCEKLLGEIHETFFREFADCVL
jgi:hypothetical protein